MARSFKEVLNDLGLGVKGPIQKFHETDPYGKYIAPGGGAVRGEPFTPEIAAARRAFLKRSKMTPQQLAPMSPEATMPYTPQSYTPEIPGVQALSQFGLFTKPDTGMIPLPPLEEETTTTIPETPINTTGYKLFSKEDVALDNLIDRSAEEVKREKGVIGTKAGMDIYGAGEYTAVDVSSAINPIVSALESAGEKVTESAKKMFNNLVGSSVKDYMEKERFYRENPNVPKSTGWFTTTEEAVYNARKQKQAEEANALINKDVIDYNQSEIARQLAQAEIAKENRLRTEAEAGRSVMPTERPDQTISQQEQPAILPSVRQPEITAPEVEPVTADKQRPVKVQSTEDLPITYTYESYKPDPKHGLYGIDATKNKKPFKGIVLHHDLREKNESNWSIKKRLNYYGTYDKTRKQSAGYHFAVDENGNLYQTAPLDKRTNHFLRKQVNKDINLGFDTQFSNDNTIGIAYLGSNKGRDEQPSAAAVRTILKLIDRLQQMYPNMDADAVFPHSLLTKGKTPTEGQQVYQAWLQSKGAMSGSRATPTD